MARVLPIGLLAGAQVLLGAFSVCAAELAGGQQADLQRAMRMVGPSGSEEPAVREERKAREPSPAFLFGAALAAWTSAHAQLDFDQKNPEAAGPPHASQSGDTGDFIAADCAEEKTAFERLETRAKALGLEPPQVLAAAGSPPAALDAWRARRAGPLPLCR